MDLKQTAGGNLRLPFLFYPTAEWRTGREREEGVGEMEAVIRKAVTRDIPEILRISSGVWDGGDYIPTVLDEWLENRDGEFVVADAEGKVAAFAKMTLLTPIDGWLEGLRGSVEYKGMGYAQQLTRYFIMRAREMGLRSLRLSTYQDNHESRHIIGKYGFHEVARFVFIGREVQQGVSGVAAQVHGSDFPWVWEKVAHSEWTQKAQGFLPNSWRFISLNEAVLRRLLDEGRVWLLPGSGALAAFFADAHSSTDYEFALLHGHPEDIPALLQHGQWLAALDGRGYVYCHCPDDDALLKAFFAGGCTHFDMEPPEVGYSLVLEYDLSDGA